MQNNIAENYNNIIITNSFIIGELVKEILNKPVLAFQNISNSYTILKEVERTHIKNITFVLDEQKNDERLEYIMKRIFRDLIPLGYNLNIKYVNNAKDFFEEDFNVYYTLNQVS